MNLFLLKLFAFFLGCLFCHFLQVQYEASPALSAALVGFAGTFLYVPSQFEKKEVQSAIYSGSFAGMCAPELFDHPFHFLLLSFIGTGIYLMAKPFVHGFGGKLGTVAFISSFIFVLLKSAW